ncbi:MAG: YjbH domain-containing protein [Nitrospirae bacterium]|nr:YjbH domain-containing protein [Nitrospirota bacterium]
MEIPTARVMKESSFRLGIGQIKPYRYYYATVSPLRGLEISGRITEILGTKITDPNWQGYGNYKDKAIDLKYQFIREGKYMPALAVGIMDPHGTRVFPSQYLVASKQIYPFDLTLGIGNGRFGKVPQLSQRLELFSNTDTWLKESQFFWGLQFAPSDRYAIMAEYSPIRYDKQTIDPAQEKFFREPVPSKFNFGVRYKPAKWFEVDLSYQRGNKIGVSVTTDFDIGKPLIPIYNAPYKENAAIMKNPLRERIISALYASGFSDIVVETENDELWIEAQNDKYFYSIKAAQAIIHVLPEILPEHIQKIHILLKDNGIPKIDLSAVRADIIELNSQRLNMSEFLQLCAINTGITETKNAEGRYAKKFRYGFKPFFEAFLNDPSGFFKYRIGLNEWMTYNPWRGASLTVNLSTYPVNNISTVNEPLSVPVRSDIVLYKKEKIILDRLMFDQINKTAPGLYSRVSAGLLEIQYAGIDAEIAKPLIKGRILLGISGSAVKKRAPDNPFQLKGNDVKDYYTTAFMNARLNIPEAEISFDIKAGRFLAGDNGARFTISKFINGVVIRAWYTITDTSVFSDRHNRGYRDKGIAVSIPLRLFIGKDSKTSYTQALSPWTRDTGQDIEHYNPLFDLIGRDTQIHLDKDKKMMY